MGGARVHQPRNPGRKSGRKKHSRKSLSKFAQAKYKQAQMVSNVLGAIIIHVGGSYRLPKGALGKYRVGIDTLNAVPIESTGELLITVEQPAPTLPPTVPLPPRTIIPPLAEKLVGEHLVTRDKSADAKE